LGPFFGSTLKLFVERQAGRGREAQRPVSYLRKEARKQGRKEGKKEGRKEASKEGRKEARTHGFVVFSEVCVKGEKFTL
jgi:flagellar biosynthesis/type III secretory pathway protein FliH